MDKVKISGYQLAFLIMGFLFSFVANPTAGAKHDAWLAYLLAWAGGFLLLGLYILISLLNPGKNLVGILQHCFGNFPGNLLSLLYCWYFIHLAAILFRNFGEYLRMGIYPETPIVFLNIISAVLVAYGVRSGLEVMGRGSEITVPVVLLLLLLTAAEFVVEFTTASLLPILEFGWQPVIKTAFTVLSFPFGELVIFLMVFPHLSRHSSLIKTSFTALLIMGSGLLLVTLRDLIVLGSDLFGRAIFPSIHAANVFPGTNLDPFLLLKYMIGAGIKSSVCIYAAARGITQVFKLDNYRFLVLPLVFAAVVISNWLYDNVLETIEWSIEYYALYTLPFQIVIPVLVLIISIIKRVRGSAAQRRG